MINSSLSLICSGLIPNITSLPTYPSAFNTLALSAGISILLPLNTATNPSPSFSIVPFKKSRGIGDVYKRQSSV